MSKKKRSYTAVLKQNALKLSKEKDNVAKAARELGIGAQLILRWKKEQEAYQHNSSLVMDKRRLPMNSEKSHV